MRFITAAALSLASLSVLMNSGVQAAPTNSSPNIVLILADDLPWYGTSVRMEAGNDTSHTAHQQTPNIDKLAASGLTFSHSYASAPVCGPSRANIQLGTTAIRSRYTANSGTGNGSDAPGVDENDSSHLLHEPHSRVNLPAEATTLAEKLREMNYKTAHFGKWHLWGGGPEQHGYDKSDGITSNEEGSPDRINDRNDPKRMFSITRNAISFIKQQAAANTPFYVQLSHYVAHQKYDALAASIKKHRQRVNGSLAQELGLNSERERQEYATLLAMMEDFDSTLGQLFAALREAGVEQNTYVILTADNGKAWKSGNHKLRGDKWWLFETGLRVPFIVKGPQIPAGSRSKINISHYDLFPTIVDWANGNVASLQGIDGISLKSHMRNPGAIPAFNNRHLYFHYPHYRNSSPHSAIINGENKLLMFYEHLLASNQPEGGYFLFRLRDEGSSNPYRGQKEETNRFSVSPSTAFALEQQFDRYVQSISSNTDYLLPTPNLAARSGLQPINVDRAMPPSTSP